MCLLSRLLPTSLPMPHWFHVETVSCLTRRVGLGKLSPLPLHKERETEKGLDILEGFSSQINKKGHQPGTARKSQNKKVHSLGQDRASLST